MRKHSAYHPKPVCLDVMGWIINGKKQVATAASDDITTLRIKNHMAMDLLRRGMGDRSQMNIVIAAFNMTDALARLRIGNEYSDLIRAGQDALYALANRGAKLGRFVFTGPELQAVNLAMEFHDAQLDVCTVSELEKAVNLVKRELRAKRARVIGKQGA